MDEKILEYFQRELSADEQAKLLKRIEENHLLKNDFMHMQNLNALAQLSQKTTDNEEGWRAFQKFIQQIKQKALHKKLMRATKYAAVALCLIASTLWATLYFSSKQTQIKYNTVFVPAGQRAQITLQDGTNVWLNAQSTLTYSSTFSKKNRKVEIVGEAFFDVAKDAKRPFIVSVQQVNIQALGTQFNVFNYPNAGYIQTDLVEGSVKVFEKNNEKNAVILHQNEQATFRNNALTKSKMNNAEHLLWKDGIFSFHNEKLIDIIQKLQVYYDVTIIVEDPEIFNTPYTGKFRQRDGIDEILKILQKIQKFTIKKDTENNSITLTK